MNSREKQAVQMQDQQSLAETRQEPPASESQVQLPAEIQGEIGRQLRQVYGQLLAQPLPGRFSELLAQLSKSEEKS